MASKVRNMTFHQNLIYLIQTCLLTIFKTFKGTNILAIHQFVFIKTYNGKNLHSNLSSPDLRMSEKKMKTLMEKLAELSESIENLQN
ncbi:hypothetical protein Anas_09541 [Armadillidium nasatum]|uniref:Uncharacterized protein n=1 Tax=Armadillidium nasatum TaxID=96803 RepID=A0A5N5T2F7_9CRUS|nr:hypothetical protein Anas_09541 [Armadillidium nasatum]